MEKMSWAGIELAAIVFALVGAALGVSYSPEMTKRQMAAAVLAGLACGALLPELVASVYHMPAIAKNGLAFIFGIGGMFIVPGVIAIWRGFANDPWAFFDRLRGKSTAPPPPPPPPPPSQPIAPRGALKDD